MTSKLIVNSIRHTGASADAITMDASGNVTFPANATCSGTATGFGGGITEIDYWRLTSNFQGNAYHIQNGKGQIRNLRIKKAQVCRNQVDSLLFLLLGIIM